MAIIIRLNFNRTRLSFHMHHMHSAREMTEYCLLHCYYYYICSYVDKLVNVSPLQSYRPICKLPFFHMPIV